MTSRIPHILVLCTGNSCRSQIAHGFLEQLTQGKAVIFSAGVEVHGVNPRAITIMQEAGIDISGHTSNLVSEYNQIPFNYVITVCDNAKESCPVLPSQGKQYHHNFNDPAKATGSEEEILNAFRKVREEIRAYCEAFVKNELDLY
jgi:arsenate reductase